jgi:hypothetical protein
MELVTHLVSPYKQTETHFLTYIMEPQIKKSLNIPKIRSEVVIQRMTDNTVQNSKILGARNRRLFGGDRVAYHFIFLCFYLFAFVLKHIS